MDKPTIGHIAWVDLTALGSEAIRNFYSEVTGGKGSGLDLGAEGYSMEAADGATPGDCCPRGADAGQPSFRNAYIPVASMDESLRACTRLGGRVLGEGRDLGPQGRFAIIQDPSGALAGLFEPPPEPQPA